LMLARSSFASYNSLFFWCCPDLDNLFLKRVNEKDVSNRIFEINQLSCQAEAKA